MAFTAHYRRCPAPAFVRPALLAVALATCLVAPAEAQVRSASQRLPAESTASVDRQALEQQIAEDVEFLERKGRLLKNVVKLVRPTVVHIEAQQQTRTARYKASVEEAGSGVIVEIHDRYFVLTNRHVIKDSDMSHIELRTAEGG